MKNFHWHFEITNKHSEVSFRTIVNGSIKEKVFKNIEKLFPQNLYSYKYLGSTTKFGGEETPISELIKL